MLAHQEDDRNNDVDLRLACTLAAVAGALNAAAFQAIGFFSANMTGNVSALSGHLAMGRLGAGAFFLAIILAFVVGAASSTLLINSGRRRQVPGIYALSILVEAILLAALGLADSGLPPTARGPVLVLGLSLLMGLQNAVVTRISRARVRTTHVSGMITDIGIGLAMLLDAARGLEPPDEVAAHREKLHLHVATVFAFLVGGVAGVLVYGLIGPGLLFAIAGILLVIALIGLYRARVPPLGAV